MKHWSEPLVGLPWEKFGRDPAGTDCLGLARLGGADIPLFGPTVDDAERLWRVAPSWRQVQEAKEGDLVVFGHRGIEDHLGVIVGQGLMLHIEAANGEPGSTSESIVERWDTPKWQRRLLGVYRHSDIALARTLPPADPDAVTVVGLSFIDPGRDPLPIGVPQGDSLAELVFQAYPEANERQRAALRVTIGDHVFPAESWAMVKPRAGSVVVVMPLPGFNWRALLSVVVSIAALAAGQFYVGPLLASTFGLTGTAAALAASASSAILALGANLLIGLLFPTPKPKGLGDPLFALSGFKNEPRPGAPFPLHFGKRRQAPVIGGRSWIEVVDTDMNHSSPGRTMGRMFLRSLFIEGIIGPNYNLILTDKKFGDTLLVKPAVEWDDPLVPEFNFKKVEIETIDWYPGDPPPKLYDHQVVPTDSMGVALTYPWDDTDPTPVLRTAGRDAEKITIVLGFPGGLFDIDTDTGDQIDESVKLIIEARLAGETTWIVIEALHEIEAQTSTAFFYAYDWVPAVRGQYEIRLTRLDQSKEDDPVQERCDWVALYAHRPESPLNGNVGLKVTAIKVQGSEQLQGTIDTYNNIASRTCPDWDADTGTWIARETSNPASAMRFAMQGPQCVFPKGDGEIDLPQIQDWHRWCDTKNLKFDYVSADEDTAPGLRTLIAAAGRASPHHDGIKWGVVIDREQSVVRAHVSAHNVIGGSFGKSRNVHAERFPDAVRAVFYDALNFYQRAERIIPWPGFEMTPKVFLETELPWETDAGRAWIEVRRRQYEQIYRPRMYRCSMDWEHLKIGRGNRALLNHSVLSRIHSSGHVRSISGQTVTLDSTVEMFEGESYGVTFRRVPAEDDEDDNSPPFETISRTVVTVPGKSNTILLSGAGGVPEIGDLAMFGGTVDAIVKSVRRAGKLGADLTFVDYAPDYFALTAAEVPPAWDGRVGEVPDSGEEPPNLNVSVVFNFLEAVDRIAFAKFTWTAAVDRQYVIEWRKVGATDARRIEPGVGIGVAVTSSLVAADNYEGRIKVQGSSIWSNWVPVDSVFLFSSATNVLLGSSTHLLFAG